MKQSRLLSVLRKPSDVKTR